MCRIPKVENANMFIGGNDMKHSLFNKASVFASCFAYRWFHSSSIFQGFQETVNEQKNFLRSLNFSNSDDVFFKLNFQIFRRRKKYIFN